MSGAEYAAHAIIWFDAGLFFAYYVTPILARWFANRRRPR